MSDHPPICCDCFKPTYRDPEFSLCISCINKAVDKLLSLRKPIMGNASTRKDEENCDESHRFETSPTKIHDSDCAMHNEPAMPNGPCDCSARSEISVIDPKINNTVFNKCIEALGQCDDEMNRWFLDEGNIRHFIAAYVTHALPATKPVSVDACVKALDDVATEGWDGSIVYKPHEFVRAILSAAGVKYVD